MVAQLCKYTKTNSKWKAFMVWETDFNKGVNKQTKKPTKNCKLTCSLTRARFPGGQEPRGATRVDTADIKNAAITPESSTGQNCSRTLKGKIKWAIWRTWQLTHVTYYQRNHVHPAISRAGPGLQQGTGRRAESYHGPLHTGMKEAGEREKNAQILLTPPKAGRDHGVPLFVRAAAQGSTSKPGRRPRKSIRLVIPVQEPTKNWTDGWS